MSARMRNKLHSDFGFKLTLLPSVWLLLFIQLALQLANAIAAKDLRKFLSCFRCCCNFFECLQMISFVIYKQYKCTEYIKRIIEGKGFHKINGIYLVLQYKIRRNSCEIRVMPI